MRIEPVPARGHVAVPGDKSISHRAVLIGALCEGETTYRGFGRSADTEATIAAVRALGVEVDEHDVDTLTVHGVGPPRPRPARRAHRLRKRGNAHAAPRGARRGPGGPVRARRGRVALARPMERIAEPLRRMGAKSRRPTAMRRSSSKAATVCTRSTTSSPCLGAGEVGGPARRPPCRRARRPSSSRCRRAITPSACSSAPEHASRAGRRASPSRRRTRLRSARSRFPGDFSSAAPLLVAAAIVPGSDLTVHGVGLNPRRTGLLDVLERMGARVAVYNRRPIGGEPAGDVEVRASELVGATIDRGRGARRSSTSFRSSRRRLPRARGDRRPGRGGAPREGVRPDRGRGRGASPGRCAHPRDARRLPDPGVPARLRRRRLDARGDHRLAMLGAVVGVSSREGVELGVRTPSRRAFRASSRSSSSSRRARS